MTDWVMHVQGRPDSPPCLFASLAAHHVLELRRVADSVMLPLQDDAIPPSQPFFVRDMMRQVCPSAPFSRGPLMRVQASVQLMLHAECCGAPHRCPGRATL